MENKLSPYNLPDSHRIVSARYAALRLKQLLLLVTLGEHQSLRQASEMLAVSQPAATKALQEVEEILGVSLFERTPNGVVPNAFGACAIDHAAIVLSTMSRMKSQLDLLGKEGRQLLRMGTIAGAVSDYFGELVGRFSSKELLLIEAEEDTSANLVNKLSLGKLDCIFVKRSADLDNNERIESEVLRSSSVCVVAASHHPLDENTLYDCADLIDYNWIAYDANTPLSELLKTWFCSTIGRKPNVWMRTASALTTLSALNNSSSLALLPMPVVQTMDEKLIKRIKTNITSCAECCIYWRNDSPVAPLIRQEIEATRPDNVVSIRSP